MIESGFETKKTKMPTEGFSYNFKFHDLLYKIF